jgi:hypothetical protein
MNADSGMILMSCFHTRRRFSGVLESYKSSPNATPNFDSYKGYNQLSILPGVGNKVLITSTSSVGPSSRLMGVMALLLTDEGRLMLAAEILLSRRLS